MKAHVRHTASGSAAVLAVALLMTVAGPATPAETTPPPTCRGVPATIVGTDEGEHMHGTRGDDVIVALGGPDTVDAGRGDDLVCGGKGADHLNGKAGDDLLNGQRNGIIFDEPILHPGDHLRGGPGADRLIGGAGKGDDVADYADLTVPVTVDLTQREATSAQSDTDRIAVDVERVRGTSEGDDMTGSRRADGFYPGPGNDVITAAGGDDVVFAGRGADQVTGGDGHDVLYGEDGPDTLRGGDGGGYLFGGYGDDELAGGPGRDFAFGNSYCCIRQHAGNDTIRTFGGGDRVESMTGDDVIDTGTGNDDVNDLGGVNAITTGPGHDELVVQGHDGDDLDGGADRDRFLLIDYEDIGIVLDLGTGALTSPDTATVRGFEIVDGTGGPDQVTGTDADETFFLFGGDDVVHAGGGHDVMYGYGGDDTLDGGDGDDEADGGPGTDDCPAVEQAEACESPLVPRYQDEQYAGLGIRWGLRRQTSTFDHELSEP